WYAFAAETPDYPVSTADATSQVRVTLPAQGTLAPTSDSQTVLIESNAPEAPPVIGRMPHAAAEPVVEALDAPPMPKYKDLWERMRAGFAMQEVDSPLVARHEAWYLNRPEYVQRMV